MRTATTDEQSRRWFRRYWTLGVGSGAHVLVNGLIERGAPANNVLSGSRRQSNSIADLDAGSGTHSSVHVEPMRTFVDWHVHRV
jgi:hypothetical protein